MEKVRSQILLAIESDQEDPEVIAATAWMRAAFPDHPYARPERGTADTVKAMTPPDLKALTQRLFGKDTLQIAGGGRHHGSRPEGAARQDLRRASRNLGHAEGRRDRSESAPGRRGDRARHPAERDDVGFAGIKRDDPDFIPAYVMNFILGQRAVSARA